MFRLPLEFWIFSALYKLAPRLNEHYAFHILRNPTHFTSDRKSTEAARHVSSGVTLRKASQVFLPGPLIVPLVPELERREIIDLYHRLYFQNLISPNPFTTRDEATVRVLVQALPEGSELLLLLAHRRQLFKHDEETRRRTDPGQPEIGLGTIIDLSSHSLNPSPSSSVVSSLCLSTPPPEQLFNEHRSNGSTTASGATLSINSMQGNCERRNGSRENTRLKEREEGFVLPVRSAVRR